jgi:hypothetical protein
MSPATMEQEPAAIEDQLDEDGMGPAIPGVVGKWTGAQKWDYADVQEWLDHLKLTTYREKFFEWGIDGRILMEMKKEVIQKPRSLASPRPSSWLETLALDPGPTPAYHSLVDPPSQPPHTAI